MPFEVLITDRAQRDLEDARTYIAKYAPETAERWCRGFLESLLILEKSPESWPLAPEDSEFPFQLRQYIYRTRSRQANRALFTIVGNQIRVLAIRRPGEPLVVPEDLR